MNCFCRKSSHSSVYFEKFVRCLGNNRKSEMSQCLFVVCVTYSFLFKWTAACPVPSNAFPPPYLPTTIMEENKAPHKKDGELLCTEDQLNLACCLLKPNPWLTCFDNAPPSYGLLQNSN